MLTSCLILSLPIKSDQIILQAEKEEKEEHVELHENIKTHFTDQAYSEEQAQFLADVGIELLQNGPLAPTATGNISPKNINVPLLEDSVEAALVIVRYPVEKAKTIAHEAVKLALAEAPHPTVRHFRAALENHLSDLGVKPSPTIAKTAVVIPLIEKALSRTPSFPLPQPSLTPASTSLPQSPAEPVSIPSAPSKLNLQKQLQERLKLPKHPLHPLHSHSLI